MSYVETSKTTGKSYLIFSQAELTPNERKLYTAQAEAYKAAGRVLKAFIEEFRKRQDITDNVSISCRYDRVNVSIAEGTRNGKTKQSVSLADFLANQ